MDAIRAETKEIVPRYYGLAFESYDSGTKKQIVFFDPSTVAMAFIAITSPEKEGGLADMLKAWQKRKPKELAGEFGYLPEFELGPKRRKQLLDCKPEKLVETVRNAIKKRHGSYNLWDCYGTSAVSGLTLMGETLTAEVRSQESGTYRIGLKGAVRGSNGSLNYTDASCQCDDSTFMEIKGGRSIITKRACIHVCMAETESYLQNKYEQPAAKKLIKEKQPYKGERSLTFNFVDDPFLQYLLMDVLIAREVLEEPAFERDLKLLSNLLIGPAITPLPLQIDILTGKASIEVIKEKNRVRWIEPWLLETQQIVEKEFDERLRRGGYIWDGYCLELGLPSYRYRNPDTDNVVSVCMNGELPFYVFRTFKGAKNKPVFSEDYGPKNPFAQPVAKQWRIDDKTKKSTLTRIEPAVRIDTPETGMVRLTRELPAKALDAYKKKIVKNGKGRLKKLGL